MDKEIKRLTEEVSFLKKQIEYLLDRNNYLEREVIGQSNALYEIMNSIEEKEWSHPNSCVHNDDPWKEWKYLK